MKKQISLLMTLCFIAYTTISGMQQSPAYQAFQQQVNAEKQLPLAQILQHYWKHEWYPGLHHDEWKVVVEALAQKINAAPSFNDEDLQPWLSVRRKDLTVPFSLFFSAENLIKKDSCPNETCSWQNVINNFYTVITSKTELYTHRLVKPSTPEQITNYVESPFYIRLSPHLRNFLELFKKQCQSPRREPTASNQPIPPIFPSPSPTYQTTQTHTSDPFFATQVVSEKQKSMHDILQHFWSFTETYSCKQQTPVLKIIIRALTEKLHESNDYLLLWQNMKQTQTTTGGSSSGYVPSETPQTIPFWLLYNAEQLIDNDPESQSSINSWNTLLTNFYNTINTKTSAYLYGMISSPEEITDTLRCFAYHKRNPQIDLFVNQIKQFRAQQIVAFSTGNIPIQQQDLFTQLIQTLKNKAQTAITISECDNTVTELKQLEESWFNAPGSTNKEFIEYCRTLTIDLQRSTYSLLHQLLDSLKEKAGRASTSIAWEEIFTEVKKIKDMQRSSSPINADIIKEGETILLDYFTQRITRVLNFKIGFYGNIEDHNLLENERAKESTEQNIAEYSRLIDLNINNLRAHIIHIETPVLRTKIQQEFEIAERHAQMFRRSLELKRLELKNSMTRADICSIWGNSMTREQYREQALRYHPDKILVNCPEINPQSPLYQIYRQEAEIKTKSLHQAKDLFGL
ncbi:MAG: hypothetical protein UU47_C0006G0014 [candidate division TM6 bacterium GW2011_GWE2_41_16]|nr:MAG: hypothetical protein UU47_C0006G0014 [candidate division TM6 bacterium GW2011_GWE2_41_16]